MAFKKEIEVIIEPKDVFVGDEDAPVTLMEFGEYESEACAKANEVVKQLLEEYEAPPIDPAIEEALREFVERRERELTGVELYT